MFFCFFVPNLALSQKYPTINSVTYPHGSTFKYTIYLLHPNQSSKIYKRLLGLQKTSSTRNVKTVEVRKRQKNADYSNCMPVRRRKLGKM